MNSKKKLLSKPVINSTIKSIIKTEIIENIKDPMTPAIVLLGLIFDIFLPLKIFPKTYPPISENIVNIIIQINKKKDEAVSFLKNKKANREITKIMSINIMVNFLLNTEKTSKFPKIKIAYKNDTI